MVVRNRRLHGHSRRHGRIRRVAGIPAPQSSPGTGSTLVKYRAFLIPAIGLLVVLGGFILTFTLNDSFVYYMTPTEALDAKVEFEEGRRFRLSGVVVAGSVEELDAGVRFLAQEPDGSTTVTVVHT
ncbi:MAG: cytochrome c maturation protein CcmE, partial [Acidimicrobiia bacterium]